MNQPDDTCGALDAALRPGVLAIVRLPEDIDPVPAALAVVGAGVGAVEIPLTTPGALDAVGRLSSADSGALVGAGSARTPADVRDAVDAGARFLVTPMTRVDVLQEASRLGVPVLAGGLTPTELDASAQAGAAYQKLFPASQVGPGYLRELLVPMPDLRVVPTGGVSVNQVTAWKEAGAAAVAVGSSLVDAGSAHDSEEIRRRSRALLCAWRETATTD